MWLRPAVSALALAAWTLAWGEAPELPERILRLSHVEGDVGLQPAHERASSGLPDRPLVRGDRLVTRDGARAELLLDASAVRLDERSELRVVALEAMRVRLALDRGVANLHLRELYEDERFEIATANVSITLREPGEYRLEARAADLSVLTVHGGAADVATAGGLVRVASGQRVLLEGRDSRATLVTPVSADAFDDWVLEREVQLADANAPAGPDENGGYGQYSRAGRWYDDSTYGHVWTADYSYGSAPWFFFSFSSGRWAFLHGQGRWCWVPGPAPHAPQVAQETRPFGHPRAAVNRGSVMTGSPASSTMRPVSNAQPRQEASGRRFVFGSSSPSSGSSTQGHTATMRPSGSSSRTRAPSSSSPASRPSVFGVPDH